MRLAEGLFVSRLSMRESIFRIQSADSGFTLVELLVVVAILGILTSVVLVSLGTANTRGKDGAIQANLDSLRTQAQLYYNENGSYSLNGTGIPASSSCTAANSVFVDSKITQQIIATDSVNGGARSVACNVAAGGAAYAVYAELASTAGAYFCVDSNGIGGRTTHAPTGTDTSCVITP